MKILGIIPARYASTRFPAKMLHLIEGKSMIQRVYEQVMQAKTLAAVWIATDHEEIYNHAKNFGANVVMTATTHISGTDRCYEAIKKIGDFDYVINIQGDEPFINPAQIDELAFLLDGKVEIATLIKQITEEEELFNPNVVKAVINHKNETLYFSRHAIPYLRGVDSHMWLQKNIFYKHIGMYAYRYDILEAITQLPPSILEKAESLEQLRWLENGYKILTFITKWESISVDTPQDLEKLKPYFKK